ncbi:dolichyl pyrophosphate Glc1Man9GlcNAc2 alpha-1,3-glucosyltransferase [Rhizoclosmatium globosum]|uniref:Alpha-1,3-glucosyltransferase n=1 Tax=Rhizoclosmatium globosum TaxID=329046 RepID=A0A1Y2BFE5_9FUNG|nr:dolichyl pyrophosphate Glc1Man9GlcNAc2 alpha-1,3-glucosyltransferase [Rhizoclosmatium globosum]|eukprot:ORY33541.1 dolichyl pyrophosphate Glc1Man9GlcNAc2 alpha-1,3-glucosyltransferase [Rhizoclosmatium globosum]
MRSVAIHGVGISRVPGVHSTDFEVHRNWLALTNSLPLSKWYYEETSEWTLDYPPFFAWFEWTMSHIAKWVDPAMVVVENLGYASDATILFQRASVVVTEAVLFYAVVSIFADVADARKRIILTALVFLSPGLLFVDNIHFQYNGFLYGIQLLSIHALWKERYLLGGVLFAVTMNFKHIYLYQAPAYFVYLLSRYCFIETNGSFSFSFLRFVKIGISVISVFLVSFGPFIQHIPQVLSRLFPFKRGLCHAYWAPNFWALYSFADRVAIQGLKLAGKGAELGEVPSLTRGLVGNSVFAVLPNIEPIHTLILTVVFQLPSLYSLWKRPTKDAFVDSLVLCGFSSFLFGWHVHEKAILLVLIPLSLVATRTRRHAQIFYILSCAGYLSLFPLIFKATETPTKVIVFLLYAMTSSHFLAFLTKETAANKSERGLQLNILERLYVYGMGPLYIYAELVHPFVFGSRLEFLPLMLVSVYCSVGVLYSFVALSFLIE